MSLATQLLPLIEEIGADVVAALLHAVQSGDARRIAQAGEVAAAASAARQAIHAAAKLPPATEPEKVAARVAAAVAPKPAPPPPKGRR